MITDTPPAPVKVATAKTATARRRGGKLGRALLIAGIGGQARAAAGHRGPAHRLRLNHLTDLTVVTYPDARHEILNETTRAEITTAMLDWLRTHHLTTT